MKPRTLARVAIKLIKDGTFVFDTNERKREAIRQIRSLLSSKSDASTLSDPIKELQLGVFVPSFDYPIPPMNASGEIEVWQENGKYSIPQYTHHLTAISESGEKYYLDYLTSFASIKEANVKVDRYTDIRRAAWVLTSACCKVINKEKDKENFGFKDLELRDKILEDNWNKLSSLDPDLDAKQHKLYVKWITTWIELHSKNPDTHMKVLKIPKKEDPAIKEIV